MNTILQTFWESIVIVAIVEFIGNAIHHSIKPFFDDWFERRRDCPNYCKEIG